MADAPGRLEVLPGGAGTAGSAPEPEPPRRRLPGGVLVWLLALLLVVMLAGLGLESRRAARLEAQVQGLSAELDRAQAALKAHRGHLKAVRASVAELQELVARDPEAAAPAAPPAPGAATP